MTKYLDAWTAMLLRPWRFLLGLLCLLSGCGADGRVDAPAESAKDHSADRPQVRWKREMGKTPLDVRSGEDGGP